MECTKEENDKNAKWVEEHRADKSYAPVPVLVTKVQVIDTSIEVTFLAATKGRDGERGPDVPVTVAWSETNDAIWIHCPSTVPMEGAPPRPTPDASGLLYIEKSLLDASGLFGTPKWPKSLPGKPVNPYAVWPTSVVVEGYLIRDGAAPRSGSVDLLNGKWALAMDFDPGAAQQITLNGEAVKLWLTPTGVAEGFGSLPLSDLQQAVEIIEARPSAHSMANAWRTVARWVELSRTEPALDTAEARDLISRVLETPAP
jgi:hypothetical protein